MSVKYSFVTCKTALSTSKLPGLTYSLNPYIGCEHGCRYCYVPGVLNDRKLALEWGQSVKAKKNIPEVLAQEVKKKPKGVVGVSTVCDPYQPIEARLELTRKCIDILARQDFPVSIQTKSELVLRDIDLIVPGKFDVGVTITTMNRKLARWLEPNAASPDKRAQVLEEFSAKGVETWLFLGPIIPEINDSEQSIREVIEVAARTKSLVLYDKLNLRQWVMERLNDTMEKIDPRPPDQEAKLIRKLSEIWHETQTRIESTCKEKGVRCEPAFSKK
ncbi:MAG: radical SAM protein [Hadesarchaea archaeon]|nr:MAG: radical SAM protein [Hadesarchaea archaeon]HDI12894.1 radical SAM protein [Hadesarchaea archaeon]